jgi:cysteine-rich repeat protein
MAPHRSFSAFWLYGTSLLALGACRGGGHGTGNEGPELDGAVEAGPESDASLPPVPGTRPRLEHAGQVVPLLYGRVVEVSELRDGLVGTAYVPLDDPEEPSHQALFSHLAAACRAEVSAEVAPPSADTAIPGCGREGVFAARVALCQARAALAFSVPDSAAGIAAGPTGPVLELEGAAGNRLWTMDSASDTTTASWAMLAVAEQRDAVARLARALDPMACASGLAEPALAAGPSLAVVAARSLAEVADALPASTARADQLLAERLRTLREQTGELDVAARERLARALNDSQLERMKLLAAIPYGAFTPVEGEPGELPRERYPLLPEPPVGAVADAATLLAALRADAVADARVARSGDELLAGWFGALRAAEPLAFGSLGEDEAEAALERFPITLADLEQGASVLADTLRATGAPLGVQHEGALRRVSGLLALEAAAAPGYPFSLTEAVATLEDDEAAYARRGLAHARELVARAARRARGRDDASDAASELTSLAVPAGRARACGARVDERVQVRIELHDLPAGEADEHALARGEDAAACAVAGQVAGAACLPGALAAPTLEEGVAVFELDDSAPAAGVLYVLGPDEAAERGVAVIAALSLAPFGDSDDETCFEVPLSSAQHERLARLHAELLTTELGREPLALAGSAPFTLAADMPVPLAFERELSVSGDGESRKLLVSPGFDAEHIAIERGLLSRCTSAPYSGSDGAGQACDARGLAHLHRLRCLADGVAALASAGGGSAGTLTIDAAADTEKLSLRLWAFELRRRELAGLALAVESFACTRLPGASSEQELEASLWSRLEEVLSDLGGRHAELRDALDAERAGAFDGLPQAERRAHEVRALSRSALAAARLITAVPHGLHELDEQDRDLLAHATTRFPVVTEPAETAEDTRIESLLRSTGVHPLAPDLTLVDGVLDPALVEDVVRSGELTSRLRERLLELDPERYAASPGSHHAFLSWLGVGQGELERAVARLVQLAEARGLGLLAVAGDAQPRALGLAPSSPAPQPLHLFALTEGRAHLAATATAESRAARGYHHALQLARRALGRRSAAAPDWSASERSAREALIASIATGPGEARLEREPDGSVAVEVALPAGVSAAQARSRYQLVWTDAGLACALHGSFGGAACEPADFLFDASALSVEPVEGGAAERLHRLSGFRFPEPASWDPELTEEPRRGRVYLVELEGETRTPIAALSLDAPAGDSFVAPDSQAFRDELVRVLAYRPPGEGCEACAPSSVCETTRCELGVCIREAVADGLSCAESTCVAGSCLVPGCGDGARADGQTEVPFEACDDGNLIDGDGCSASCSIERRELEPLVKEAFPGGPGPAIAIDGLGQVLIVYRKDALELGDDSAPIQAARFDAFGVIQGGPLSIEPATQRGARADPTVVGLRDGGFVVLYASPSVEGEPGLAYRIISSTGQVGEARAVESSGALQLEGRVAALEDGFAVVFVERSATSTRARLRWRRFDGDGNPFGASLEVAPALAPSAEQREPTLATSQGQLLIAWSESSSEGDPLGVRARRYDTFGAAVDGEAFGLVSGAAGQPSAGVLGSGDYVVAYRSAGAESTDITARTVRRFGFPLESSTPIAVAASVSSEDLPVVAGAEGDSFVVAYQVSGSTGLFAPTIDAESGALASELLAESDQRDVSAVTGATGIWLTWSQRLAQGRALYALLLPFDAP